MEPSVRQLARLVHEFDPELSAEVQAVLEGWAGQTEQFEYDGSVNPRGSQPSADYRTLAAEFERMRSTASAST